MRKKLLALLLAAALALSLLAGCGGKNQSLAQIILNLLDNQYTNVTVEIDPDLEAALRKAVSGAETKEEIRAALEELLGPGISFRLLGDGQKGDTAWNLILYPGNDPDAAGRSERRPVRHQNRHDRNRKRLRPSGAGHRGQGRQPGR